MFEGDNMDKGKEKDMFHRAAVCKVAHQRAATNPPQKCTELTEELAGNHD